MQREFRRFSTVSFHSVVFGAVLAMSLGLTGCFSGSGSTGGTAAGSGSTAGGGVASDGSLQGTWDVIATQPDGAQGLVTVEVNDSAVFVRSEVGDGTLLDVGDRAALMLDLASSKSGRLDSLHAQRTSAPTRDVGVLPFDVSGSWTLGKTCWSHFDNELALTCGEAPAAPAFAKGETTGKQVTTAASQFGSLGGQWSFQLPAGQCEATLQGDTLNASCSGTRGLDGNLSVQWGQGKLSGTLGNGIEFTAIRRQTSEK